jgi:hypothetical protein
MRVYYFTKHYHAVSDLALKRLKVSTFNNVNDPFELLGADLLDPRDREALANFKSTIELTHGMICFSGSWGNPLLWGHYAANHTGVAFGFDIPDEFLHEVDYTEERIKIEFDEATRKIIDGEAVVQWLLKTKFSDWNYEDERRMFIGLSPLKFEGDAYFEEFSEQLVLREVVLGMRCNLSIPTVKRLIGVEGRQVAVLKAGMALRKFKIIEDRSARSS